MPWRSARPLFQWGWEGEIAAAELILVFGKADGPTEREKVCGGNLYGGTGHGRVKGEIARVVGKAYDARALVESGPNRGEER
ncbi:MAG: hypothetical protein NVS9B14_00870 [Candidatus Acidiferrum sp.]